MPLTKKPLQNRAQALGIERAFQALKSSFDTRAKSDEAVLIQSGLFAENLVIEHFLSLGYQLLAHRVQLRSCEIDLVFTDGPGKALIVEVKTQNSDEYIDNVISKKQISRLKRAFCELAPNWPSLKICLAIVSHKGKIQIVDDIFG